MVNHSGVSGANGEYHSTLDPEGLRVETNIKPPSAFLNILEFPGMDDKMAGFAHKVIAHLATPEKGDSWKSWLDPRDIVEGELFLFIRDFAGFEMYAYPTIIPGETKAAPYLVTERFIKQVHRANTGN